MRANPGAPVLCGQTGNGVFQTGTDVHQVAVTHRTTTGGAIFSVSSRCIPTTAAGLANKRVSISGIDHTLEFNVARTAVDAEPGRGGHDQLTVDHDLTAARCNRLRGAVTEIQITTNHGAVTQGLARTGLEETAVGYDGVTQKLHNAITALARIGMQQHVELIHCGVDVGRRP